MQVSTSNSDEHLCPKPFPIVPIFRHPEAIEKLAAAAVRFQITGALGSPPTQFDMAKAKKGSVRRVERLSLHELLVYNGIAREFAFHSAHLENGISYSFRPNTTNSAGIWFPNKEGKYWRYNEFQLALATMCELNECVAQLDLKDYFEWIRHSTLMSQIYRSYESRSAMGVEELDRCFFQLGRLLSGIHPTEIGLPQGPMASFFFADIYLLPIDASTEKNRRAMGRFVDDMNVGGESKGNACAHADQIAGSLEELGLALNSSKCTVEDSSTIRERINRRNRVRDQVFEQRTLRNSEDFLKYAAGRLMDELREEQDPKCINILLGTIGSVSEEVAVLSPRTAQSLIDGYRLHSRSYGDSVIKWSRTLGALAPSTKMQELLLDELSVNSELLPTDRAIAYQCLAAAKSIVSEGLLCELSTMAEVDASSGVLDESYSGSTASEIGHALKLCMELGCGREIIHDVFRENNSHPEMRRYTAVAATYLKSGEMHAFLDKQLETCVDWQEQTEIDYLRSYGDPSAGSRRPPIDPEAYY